MYVLLLGTILWVYKRSNWTGKLGADDAEAMKATNEKAKGLIDRSDKPYP